MAEKAPYKLTIKLDSARPDALGQALQAIRDIAGEYDQTGEGDATIAIECWQEKPLIGIRDDVEEWLFQHAIGLGCKVRIDAPGIRPEMETVLRARKRTPMDHEGWDDAAAGEAPGAPIVTPDPLGYVALPPPVPRQLPAPSDDLILDGEYTVESEAA